MAQTAGHARSDSVPRLPFQTPVMHQAVYKQTAVHSTPEQQTNFLSTTKASKASQMSEPSEPSAPTKPSLNVIVGFDNPRTPPPPGYISDTRMAARGHRRKESIQERRAKTKADETNALMRQHAPAMTLANVSPSDRTVVIGFDNAVKTLNIQTSIDHIISPITPSIIVTSVPKEDGSSSEDIFLKANFDKHRSSYYSQPTHALVQDPFHSDSAASTPPVPVIPHDLLDPNNTLLRNISPLTSWSTDLEDSDDQSLTYVGSTPAIKDDKSILMLSRTNTNASKGWWNEITTPFLLARSATFRTTASRSPPAMPSPQLSVQPSPQPSPQPSSTGSKLTVENVAALDRAVPTSEATTPHLADEKRATMGFFGEATPKTATFPELPPIPRTHQGQLVASPELIQTGAFGLAAEYWEASMHDDLPDQKTPFYRCINHDCSRWNPKADEEGVSDEKQRELFNQAIHEEHAAKQRGFGVGSEVAMGAAAGLLAGGAMGIAAHHFAGSVVSHRAEHEEIAQTPSINGHVDPSDSVSQVAERAALSEPSRVGLSTAARSIPEPKQTINSDTIGSPEVVRAMAIPIVRGVSPMPTSIPERSAHIRSAPSVALAPAAHAVSFDRAAPSQAPPAASEAAMSRGIPPPPPPPVAINHEEIGIARSLPSPEPTTMPNHSQERSLPPTPAPEPEPAPFVPTKNPFRRVPVPLSVEPATNSAHEVSPGAMTPNLAREANAGNAVPMSAPRGLGHEPAASAPSHAPASVAPVAAAAAASAFTHRGMLENYNRKSTPSATGVSHVDDMPTEAHRAAPSPPSAAPGPSVPAPVYVPDGARFGPMPSEQSHDLGSIDNEKSTKPETPSKFALMLARWKEKRNKNKKPRTKEQKKKRRMCCGIFCCLLIMIIVILILILTLTIPRHDMSVQSSWLNLTDFPPLPTGVATIARPNAVKEQSGCVQPSTMWSCALPKEMQDGVKPNAPNQPNFRIELRFRNDSSVTNGTVVGTKHSRRGLYQRDSFTDNLYNPSPAPPGVDDQKFLGNTTDHNSAPFEGEATPFYISFLPTVAQSNSVFKRQDSTGDSSSSGSDPSNSATSGSDPSSSNSPSSDVLSSAPSSSASSSSLSSSPSSTSTSSSPSSSATAKDPFPNVTSAIPPAAINPDGTAASATLYPLPSAQPLRLYNRGRADEHYGFYTYFDRSIFLTSAKLANSSWSYNTADIPGGAPESAASLRCTWAQTRFLVQIWTRMDPATAQLLNGSALAEAAAAGNITQDSQSNFNQPGSFPYPVTVTLDRHGGDAKQKMVYCYDMQGMRVNDTSAKLSLEARGFGGSLVNPAGLLFGDGSDPTSKAGGIDGGTGGCGCVWQNWQQVGSATTGTGGASGSSGSASGQQASSSSFSTTPTSGRRRRRSSWHR